MRDRVVNMIDTQGMDTFETLSNFPSPIEITIRKIKKGIRKMESGKPDLNSRYPLEEDGSGWNIPYGDLKQTLIELEDAKEKMDEAFYYIQEELEKRNQLTADQYSNLTNEESEVFTINLKEKQKNILSDKKLVNIDKHGDSFGDFVIINGQIDDYIFYDLINEEVENEVLSEMNLTPEVLKNRSAIIKSESRDKSGESKDRLTKEQRVLKENIIDKIRNEINYNKEVYGNLDYDYLYSFAEAISEEIEKAKDDSSYDISSFFPGVGYLKTFEDQELLLATINELIAEYENIEKSEKQEIVDNADKDRVVLTDFLKEDNFEKELAPLDERLVEAIKKEGFDTYDSALQKNNLLSLKKLIQISNGNRLNNLKDTDKIRIELKNTTLEMTGEEVPIALGMIEELESVLSHATREIDIKLVIARNKFINSEDYKRMADQQKTAFLNSLEKTQAEWIKDKSVFEYNSEEAIEKEAFSEEIVSKAKRDIGL